MKSRVIDRRYEKVQDELRYKLKNAPYLGNRKEGFKSGLRCAMSKLHAVYGKESDVEGMTKAERYHYVMDSLQAKEKKKSGKPMDQGFNEGLEWAMKEIEKVYGGDQYEA